MKTYSDLLTEIENNTIDYLLSFSFSYPEIFIEQIRCATFQRDYSPYFRLLYVNVPKHAHSLPESCNGIPVEIQSFLEDGSICCFLVHVANGYIQEIEIYKADNSMIDLNSLFNGKAYEGLAKRHQ